MSVNTNAPNLTCPQVHIWLVFGLLGLFALFFTSSEFDRKVDRHADQSDMRVSMEKNKMTDK